MVIKIGPASATVIWNTPANRNNPTTGFLVHITGNVTNETLPVPGHQNYITLENLQPSTLYTIRVQSVNEVKPGNLSAIVTFRTLDEPSKYKLINAV